MPDQPGAAADFQRIWAEATLPKMIRKVHPSLPHAAFDRQRADQRPQYLRFDQPMSTPIKSGSGRVSHLGSDRDVPEWNPNISSHDGREVWSRRTFSDEGH